jgi:hypothetical protein
VFVRCLRIGSSPDDGVDHRTLFAPDYPIGAVVETRPLIAAAKLVALVVEGTSPIRLSFAPRRVAVEAGDEAQGSEIRARISSTASAI